MPTQTIDTSFAVFVVEPGARVHVTAKPGDHTLVEATASMAIFGRVCSEHGKRVRAIVDIRATRSVSREARQLYLQDSGVNLGTALLVDSGISRVIGNFIIGLNRGAVQVRLFEDEQAARAWLEALADA